MTVPYKHNREQPSLIEISRVSKILEDYISSGNFHSAAFNLYLIRSLIDSQPDNIFMTPQVECLDFAIQRFNVKKAQEICRELDRSCRSLEQQKTVSEKPLENSSVTNEAHQS